MKKLNLLLTVGIIALFASCTTPGRLTYLKDMKYGQQYAAQKAPELKLQPEDKISIQVFSSDPQLAAPFNTTGGFTEGAQVSASQYTIDNQGNIDFPVLGHLRVEGKTVTQVKNEIASRIIEMGYIREPIVKVELNNFQITVLGENNNRILPVTGESINLLQVVAQAGSMGIQQKITDVMVIRTENGVRTAYSVNLQKKALFDSPVFYLQQNDIVYIKPRGLRTSPTMQAIMSALSPIFSLGSIVSTLFIWSKL